MQQVFEKQCGYHAYRVCQGHYKQANVLVNAPGHNKQTNSLHFIILISFCHIDLVAPVVVIKNCIASTIMPVDHGLTGSLKGFIWAHNC